MADLACRILLREHSAELPDRIHLLGDFDDILAPLRDELLQLPEELDRVLGLLHEGLHEGLLQLLGDIDGLLGPLHGLRQLLLASLELLDRVPVVLNHIRRRMYRPLSLCSPAGQESVEFSRILLLRALLLLLPKLQELPHDLRYFLRDSS